jgi:hypothetical protein
VPDPVADPLAFDADWLALREPYDHAARSEALGDRFAAALPAKTLDIVDLGCGLGSNLRWLAPRIDRPQRWILVDHDPALLDRVPEALIPWAAARGIPVGLRGATLVLGARIEVDRVALDLRKARWPDADAIVTQALLDLCDDTWLATLVERTGPRPLLAALTVDGRVRWDPADPDDDRVLGAFRAHQTAHRLGPWAAPWLAGRLAALGRTVALAEADWRIGADRAAMLTVMADGAREAAGEVLGVAAVAGWHQRRKAQIAHKAASLVVGHLDLVAP